MKALVVSLLFFFTVAVAGQDTSPKKIFRTITVGNVGKTREISLGGELTKVVDLLVKEGDSFKFERGFGGAQEIRVFVTKTAKVQRIVFNYADGTSFEDKLASYSQSLGKPKIRQDFSSGILTLRLVAWDDGKTRFELLEKVEGVTTSVSAAMIDRNKSKRTRP